MILVLISIMYHRFNESKYPSTNIQLDVFKKQLKLLKKKIKFIHPKDFKKSIKKQKRAKNFIYSR